MSNPVKLLIYSYAFAVLSFEVICNRPAWQNVSMSLLDSVRNGFRPTFPNYVEKTLESLIKECWHDNPESRPKAALVLQTLSNFSATMLQDQQNDSCVDQVHNVEEILDPVHDVEGTLCLDHVTGEILDYESNIEESLSSTPPTPKEISPLQLHGPLESPVNESLS